MRVAVLDRNARYSGMDGVLLVRRLGEKGRSWGGEIGQEPEGAWQVVGGEGRAG